MFSFRCWFFDSHDNRPLGWAPPDRSMEFELSQCSRCGEVAHHVYFKRVISPETFQNWLKRRHIALMEGGSLINWWE